ncbi:MAG: hypothetical protein JNJ63_00510 [Hyphomonadaceae bacterium]|nr:hypothetical protein [Hyphomonadaceae bacterium]
MPDVFLPHAGQRAGDAALICQRLEELHLSVVDQCITGSHWRARASAHINSAALVVVFFAGAAEDALLEVVAAAEAAGKRVLLAGPEAVLERCLDYTAAPAFACADGQGGALAALAHTIADQSGRCDPQFDSDEPEPALPVISDQKLRQDWDLSFWLDSAMAGSPATPASAAAVAPQQSQALGVEMRSGAAAQRLAGDRRDRGHLILSRTGRAPLLPESLQRAFAGKARSHPVSPARYQIRRSSDSPELRKAIKAIEQAAWSSLGFLNFTRAHFAFYQDLLDCYPEYQMCLVDRDSGYPVAVGACAPLVCDFNALPDEGWDWLVEKAASDISRTRHNALGVLSISVPGIHRGKGLVGAMIASIQHLARERGLQGVVAPVRPSAKQAHPFVPIESYARWVDDKGRPFDPYLRAHLAAGGKMLNPAGRSAVIEEPTAFWEMMTGRVFEKSDDYALDGAIAPVRIDLEQGAGRYEEPSIWFAYSLAP